MPLHAADEPTVAMTHPATRQSSSKVRAVGRIFDWLAIGVMALAVCAFICQQGVGSFHTVRTAAEFPLMIAMAASTPADPHGQGYVERTEWTKVGTLPSLRVYPTSAGREPSVGVVDPGTAWAQVIAVTPDADTPGMREQFVCHLRFAEFAEPGKVSWNLEPWRPIVNGAKMIESRCNPGGAEEEL